MSDSAVINLISTTCVPVALDHHKVSVDKGETGDFYRSVYNQLPRYQGLWLVSPDGRVLGAAGRGMSDDATWVRTVLADLKSGLAKFGAVAPRRVVRTNPVPYRGIGVRPDGSVRLAVEDRPIPDYINLSQPIPPKLLPDLALGSVELSAAEWSALAPPVTEKGSRWTIPEAVGRRFFPMLDWADVHFTDPRSVTEVQLAGRVASLRDGIAHLVYDGQIVGVINTSILPNTDRLPSKDHEARSAMEMIGGAGAYDIRTGQMLSLTWVWKGACSLDIPPRRGTGTPFGTLVEWRRGVPPTAPDIESKGPVVEPIVELADSTPEDALKTFLLALAAHDEATLRAVALPHAELNLLLSGPAAAPEQLALLRARLEEKPIKRLKTGDPVRTPDGESRVIKPGDVREGRVVLWPAGAPLPSRLENVGGHWRVFAAPFISARKSVKVSHK